MAHLHIKGLSIITQTGTEAVIHNTMTFRPPAEAVVSYSINTTPSLSGSSVISDSEPLVDDEPVVNVARIGSDVPEHDQDEILEEVDQLIAEMKGADNP